MQTQITNLQQMLEAERTERAREQLLLWIAVRAAGGTVRVRLDETLPEGSRIDAHVAGDGVMTLISASDAHPEGESK